jgi:pfkB family carbohydrate kinase
VDVALALAREGRRVGLATVLADDAAGRAWFERIAEAGVDVGGVTLARPRTGFVLVDASGGANQVPTDVEEQPPLEVPEAWTSELLLLSGLSPVVSHAAALCKAARAARRKGTLVLLDFNASLHAWAGRDARTIRMVLREVDAARCSLADLAVVGLDVAMVRELLRGSGWSRREGTVRGGRLRAARSGSFSRERFGGRHDGRSLRGAGPPVRGRRKPQLTLVPCASARVRSGAKSGSRSRAVTKRRPGEPCPLREPNTARRRGPRELFDSRGRVSVKAAQRIVCVSSAYVRARYARRAGGSWSNTTQP